MTKKYILKPGKHQFAPASHATHHNDNLTDAEAQWYLERYPHITTLFETIPTSESESVASNKKSVESPKNTIGEIPTKISEIPTS